MIRNVLLTILFCLLALPALAQSGRVKKKAEKQQKKTKDKVVYRPTQKVLAKPKAKPTVSPTPIIKNDGEIIKIESMLVPIPVSVIDNRNGKAVTTLGINDFKLRVDNKLVEISELFRSESPVRLALLFDNSSSVTNAREFEQKAAIRFFRQVIRPNRDLASLFSVAGISRLEQPMTKDISRLIRAIRLFAKPKGATALHDGIIKASNYLQDYSGRRVIVIVSDGQDTLSDSTFDEMVKAVQENNCQVYIVHTNEFENYTLTGDRGGSANLRALAAERRMQSLAEQTGGAVYSPIDEAELDNAFRQISADLSQQYILGYYPEREVKDGRFRTIDLEINSQRSLTIRARRGYYVKRKVVRNE